MAIQVEDLCYTYGEGTALERQALKHVSFEIQDGEFVGLIGHTGSGRPAATLSIRVSAFTARVIN